jgi:hypothetical protein
MTAIGAGFVATSGDPTVEADIVVRRMDFLNGHCALPPNLEAILHALDGLQGYWRALIGNQGSKLHPLLLRPRRERPRRRAAQYHAHAQANCRKSKIRARIEHVFGTQQTSPGGRIVRTIGIMRARAKIGLQNLAYNIRRFVTLERIAAA